MKVKLTHPINDPVPLQAGQVLEVSSTLAKIWIENDWAFEIVEDRNELLINSFGTMANIDMSKGVEEIKATTKKVKNGNG